MMLLMITQMIMVMESFPCDAGIPFVVTCLHLLDKKNEQQWGPRREFSSCFYESPLSASRDVFSADQINQGFNLHNLERTNLID